MQSCAYNYMASEALVESSDIGAFALSPVPEQVDSVEADWNAVGETSNKWVEALLQESPAEVFDFGAVSLDTARRTVTCHGRYTRFSPLDFALLLILARHKNRIISYSRICRRLWGPTCKVSVPCLRVHVFRVRQKLERESMSGIRIINRGGLGYMMEFDNQVPRRAVRRKEFTPESSDIMASTRPLAPEYNSRKISTAAE